MYQIAASLADISILSRHTVISVSQDDIRLIHTFVPPFFFSTASSALNAMALVVLEDIVKKRVKYLTDADAAKLCKIVGG